MNSAFWVTPAALRIKFDEQFYVLVNQYVSSYKGTQPIKSWLSDQAQPVIHSDFLNHLPDHVRQSVRDLVQSIAIQKCNPTL